MKKTALLVIAIIFAISILMLVGCESKSNCLPAKTENSTSSSIEDHTTNVTQEVSQEKPKEEPQEKEKILVYNAHAEIAFNGTTLTAYSNVTDDSEVIDSIELGESKYCGFSSRGNLYFLRGTEVIKVIFYKKFEDEIIANDVESVIDTNFHYAEDEDAALLVKKTDGSYKVWAYDKEWK